MSQWPMVKLGDVAQIISGLTFKKTEVKDQPDTTFNCGVIRATNFHNSTLNLNNLVYAPNSIVKQHQLLSPNDIAIIASSGSLTTIGNVALVDFNKQISFGAFLRVIRVKSDRILTKFLFHFLSSNATQKRLKSLSQGANIKNLRQADLLNLKIPLPPLEEQRRIARVLRHSTLQISSVNKTIDKLDIARQGCIEEYATDPSKSVRLDGLADLQGGLSLSRTREVNPVEVEYLRVANVQRNNLILTNLKTIRCTEKEIERCSVKDGDILMLEANANPLEVGRAAIAAVESRHMVFQNHLFRVRPTEVSPIVLNALLSSVSVRKQLLRLAKTTSGLNTMTISQARSLRIPLRDESTTREFERQLTRIEQQKEILTAKLVFLEELHRSLATRAFAGQL